MTATSRPFLLSAVGIVTLLLGACGDQPEGRRDEAGTVPSRDLLARRATGERATDRQGLRRREVRRRGCRVRRRRRHGRRLHRRPRPLPPRGHRTQGLRRAWRPGRPTPWDFRREPGDSLAKNTATVEFHDEQGLRKLPVRHFHGLDHLSRVYVKGTARRDASNNLTIVASGIHVAQEVSPAARAQPWRRSKSRSSETRASTDDFGSAL